MKSTQAGKQAVRHAFKFCCMVTSVISTVSSTSMTMNPIVPSTGGVGYLTHTWLCEKQLHSVSDITD